MTPASRLPTLRSQAHLQGTQSQRRKTQPCKRSCLHLRRPSYISLCIFNLLAWGSTNSYGQKISRSTLFSKQPITELTQHPPTPQQQKFQEVSTTPVVINNYNPILGNNPIEQQNRIILQQQGMLPGQNNKQREVQQLKQELRNDEIEAVKEQRLAMMKPFQNSLQEILKMNPDSFSVTEAIYLTESAWYDKAPTYQQFENAIKQRSEVVKQILKQQGINPNSNIAKNYGIQKLYTQDNKFINPKTKQTSTAPKISYDFNDFSGDKNWSNMFVTKLLGTGKGQCHSMPLLYLAIAEQLGAKAYLSLSPEHSFIQYFNENGYRYNFETTNGNLVNQTWLMQRNYINATALKNKTYLDTLSNRQLYAQLLSDLLQNYTEKVGYDEFSEQLTKQILALNPKNLVAIMTQANYNTFIARDELKAVGNPPVNEIPNHPKANQAYQNMLQSYQLIEEQGFQDIPKDAYQQWLKTIETDKKKQENREIQKRMKAEIEMLKKLKPKMILTPRG
ncbi:MAG: transglutaminase family protein [Ferruginibacter sp.]